MDNLKSFYEMKELAIEDLENTVRLELNDLEQYLKKYDQLYRIYELVETENATQYKEKILTNVKILVDTQKSNIKNRLNHESDNLVEVSNDYSDFIAYLITLQEKFPVFKSVIEIDDII